MRLSLSNDLFSFSLEWLSGVLVESVFKEIGSGVKVVVGVAIPVGVGCTGIGVGATSVGVGCTGAIIHLYPLNSIKINPLANTLIQIG